MKKTYQQPISKVAHFKAMTVILCASPNVTLNTGKTSDTMQSRDFDFDDEEEY